MDKKSYVGQWLNNKMHGEGHLTWPDGKQYIGHFDEDKRQG
jgi:hypothetical protein